MPTTSPGSTPRPGTGRSLSRRALVTGVTAAGLAAAVTGTATAGSPAPATALAGSSQFDVVLHPDGLTAPASVPAGVVTFRVTTPQPAGRALLLVRLAGGTSIDAFLADLAVTSSPDPTVRAAAARRLEEVADYLGGGVVSGGVDVAFTRDLRPGTYHLVNFDYASATAIPPYALLTVDGRERRRWPVPDDLVVHTVQGSQYGFLVPSQTLRARGDHLVVNATSAPHELMLAPVRPGTTAEQVRTYYASLSRGVVPPRDQVPITNWPNGLASLDPGGTAVLRTDFTPGEYLMFSYITNRETGFPRAYEGMFRLTTLV